MRMSLLWTSRAVALVTLVLSCGVAGVVLPAGASATEPSCPNEQVRGESLENSATKAPYSMQLPDCRAYELVSPSNTLDEPAMILEPVFSAQPGPQPGPALVTPSGAVLYKSEALPLETGGVANGRTTGIFVSNRGSTGWGTTDLTPFGIPTGLVAVDQPKLLGASANGAKALIMTEDSLVPEDKDVAPTTTCEREDFYVVSMTHGPVLVSHGTLERGYVEGTCICTPGGSQAIETPGLVGPGCYPSRHGLTFDSELTTVGFSSVALLDPGVKPPRFSGGYYLPQRCYTWSESGEQIATFTDLYSEEDQCGQVGMLRDGSPVFLDENSDPYAGRLFVGGNGSNFPESSAQVSGNVPDPSQSFDAVSPDGKAVYVTTSDQLQKESEETGQSNIYAVHVPEVPWGAERPHPGNVSCVSCDAIGDAASFVGQSTDGSHVFFETSAGLWSWDAQSHEPPTRLTEATGISQLAFSTNGQYAVGIISEALYEFTGGAPQKEIASGNSYASPVVSNDGQHVVYEDSQDGGGLQVVEEWVDGRSGQVSPLGAPVSVQLLGTAGEELQDVFFVGHQPLVAQDLNSGTSSIYDARVDGGFPTPTPPANSSQTPNPTDIASSPYPANLTPPSVQPPLLAADTSQSERVSKSKALTQAQKLSKALKECKSKPKKRRATCEKQARKQYGKTKHDIKPKTRGKQ